MAPASTLPRLKASLVASAGTIVFGMEDGTVSIFGLVFGVAATTTSSVAVLVAGAGDQAPAELAVDDEDDECRDEQHPQERQAIRELVDLRLIHLIDSNTSSAPSDGRRYEAYILDVGLYENSRPRNFNQVEPGSEDSRSRKDQLRASPRLILADLAGRVKELSNGELIVSERPRVKRRSASADAPSEQGDLF